MVRTAFELFMFMMTHESAVFLFISGVIGYSEQLRVSSVGL